MLEIGCHQPLDAAAYGGEAKAGPVGDQSGKQRPVGLRALELVAGERPERAGEATTSIDIQQDIFEPDPGHAALDQLAQRPQLGGDGEGIGPAQAQLALIDAGKVVGWPSIGRP